MRYRRFCQLPLVRFDAAAAAVIDAADGPGGVWVAFGGPRRYGHPVLDRAPWLVVDRDRRLAYHSVLLLRAGPPGTAQLRTRATDVIPAVVAVVVAVTAHTGRPARLSCGSHHQATQIRRLLLRLDRIRLAGPACTPGRSAHRSSALAGTCSLSR